MVVLRQVAHSSMPLEAMRLSVSSMRAHTQVRATLNHFGRVAPQVAWQMPHHVHDDFSELILVLGGTLEVAIGGECLRGQRGDLLTYPRGEGHAEHAIGSEPLETLFLAWQWQAPSGVVDWPLHVPDRTGRVQHLLYWMQELFPPTRQGEQHMLDVLVDALLFEMHELGRTREQEMVSVVKAFVQHHIAEPLHLDDLAREVGLSKYHFCRAFKAEIGVSPMAFVRQVRVEATRSLLLSTGWTLRAIAEQVGFADEYQLSRVFRRVTGQPPSQVRSSG
jgi:AraC-like DNA-binding protein/mannose-6-phosphate isomerase-like protein (cupin superfamily)